jgi:hypothetical protein
MKVRHLAAAITIAAVALVATSGIAEAHTTATPQSSSRKAAACAKATGRLPAFQARITKVEARVAQLQARLTTAKSKNHTKQVKVIQARVDASNALHNRLTKLVDEIDARCAT